MGTTTGADGSPGGSESGSKMSSMATFGSSRGGGSTMSSRRTSSGAIVTRTSDGGLDEVSLGVDVLDCPLVRVATLTVLCGVPRRSGESTPPASSRGSLGGGTVLTELRSLACRFSLSRAFLCLLNSAAKLVWYFTVLWSITFLLAPRPPPPRDGAGDKLLRDDARWPRENADTGERECDLECLARENGLS